MTKIEWTEQTWNPITGCTKISLGCKNCYAERMAKRLKSMGINQYQNVITDDGHWTGITEFTPSKLQEPLRRKRSTTYFVCSMSDLFHEGIELEWLTDIFEVMAKTPQHTYQVLTKRSDRLMPLWDEIGTGVAYRLEKQREPGFWPLDNVWLGVSVENQAMADERIPYLLRTPAAVKFLSCEPLLGPIDLWSWLPINCGNEPSYDPPPPNWTREYTRPDKEGLLHWIIVGGESGPKARPCHPDWVRSIRDQCQAADVPLFFKQWGEHKEIQFDKRNGSDLLVYPTGEILSRLPSIHDSHFIRTVAMRRVGKKAAGRLLDGREWNEYPKEQSRTMAGKVAV